MSRKPLYITDEESKAFLSWKTLVPAMEEAMADVSRKEVVQPARLFMPIPSKEGALLAMPALSKPQNALGCKVVTSFSVNTKKGLPSIFATILYMDADTGVVKMIVEGTEITTWRTVAASMAATKTLHRGEKKVLAILGAGTQGRMHAIGMKQYFNFDQVRIWNRTHQKAKMVCDELGSWCVPYENKEDCVRGADVIVTATYSQTPVVMKDWVKEGAHINSIGVGTTHYSELEEELYKDSRTAVYTDSYSSAECELKGLIDLGVTLTEVGRVISKELSIPSDARITVFQSLGMGIEDTIAAKLVYESYLKANNITENHNIK